MGSFMGGLFGADKAEAHAMSGHGLLIRRTATIALGLVALYSIADYIAEW